MPFGLQKVQKTVGTSQQQQRSSKNPFCILIFQLAADLFFHYLVGMQVIFFYTSRDPKYFIASHLLHFLHKFIAILQYFNKLESYCK